MVAYPFAGRNAPSNPRLPPHAPPRAAKAKNRSALSPPTTRIVDLVRCKQTKKYRGSYFPSISSARNCTNGWKTRRCSNAPSAKPPSSPASIERRHPGQQKNGPTDDVFSSDLIYDVLNKYEPSHILLRAARQDAEGGLIDTGRLSTCWWKCRIRSSCERWTRFRPLAVPMLLEIAKESVSRREAGEYYLEDLEQTLLAEAGLEPAS